MKILYRNIGLILILISPLFSALLTEDLQVVSPTGVPMHDKHSGLTTHLYQPAPVITLKLIETSDGVLLVREHSRRGVVQLSHPIWVEHDNNQTIIFRSSSRRKRTGESTTIDVILE